MRSKKVVGTARLRGSVALRLAILSTVVLFGGCVILRVPATRIFGAARTTTDLLAAGTIPVPSDPRGSFDSGVLPDAGVVADIIDEWASRGLPDWHEEGKVEAPRVMLAKLARGVEIEEVNAYLQNAEPWAGIGSTYALRRSGDYDFSLPPLTAILYQYGENEAVLYPETRDHLLNVLLNQDGNRFRTTVPGSMGLVTETENHILMTEGSRYLKNQWLVSHGATDPRYDNSSNGMHEKLLEFIQEMNAAGSYEFNSSPYIGYTVMALLTLESFADPEIAGAAREALDRMNYEFALGSSGLRRYSVFRRQPSRADRTSLLDHPHISLMRAWVWQATGEEFPIEYNTHQAVYAALMPYRLPSEIAELAVSGSNMHYVRIGRGPGASPELYSGGADFLLSSGGTGRSRRSLIVARPIVLFLNDGAEDLSDLFWIGGEGNYRRWNNTGVIPGFAVARAPAHRPEEHSPVAQGETWTIYRAPADHLLVAVGETNRTAAIYLLYGWEAAELLDRLEEECGSAALDSGSVRLPDGRRVEYDLDAPADEWVIVSLDGYLAERDVTAWPRLSGTVDQ